MNHKPLVKFDLVEPTDPILNKRALKVTDIDSPAIQNVIDYMIALSAGKGHDKEDTRQMVGLAAPQLGVSKRIITIDRTADGSNKKQTLQVFINPEIVKSSQEMLPGREGCWSCGNICGNVTRAESVVIEGFDRYGKLIHVGLDGFVARIAQHEVDHLNGIRFPDRIPVDEPEHLHWVEVSEFDEYRKKWMEWTKLCSRETWYAMKTNESSGELRV
jgi:peptide deformylase